MMWTTIAKSWTFDAAHQLPNHDGKCAQLHGHTYRVTVEVGGTPQPVGSGPQEGMVIDFAVLQRVWEALERDVDHRLLNETLPVPVTTSELIARFILDYFTTALQEQPVAPVRVRVAETGSTWAEVMA